MFEMFVGAKYKFMEKRRYAYILSTLLVLASVASLVVHHGPKESIDFTGGNLLFVEFDREVDVRAIREATELAAMEGAEVQMAESNHQAIIRFRTAEGDTSSQFDHLATRLQETAGEDLEVTLMSQEEVGPKIGQELERKATNAILYSLVLILAYIAFRFSRISFGLGAVIALFHDILITLGLFSVMNIEVSLTVVAAFLTIGGYSINDTIVVFDRIRENMGLLKRMTFADVIDKSVNQTLSRTILTSGSTLLAVFSLYFLGGTVIHDFAFAMLVGIVIGTYSSIFVASALALDISTWWTRRKAARQEGGTRRAVAAR